MGNDNLHLIIGTVPAGYQAEAVKQMAKAMADAIDKTIIEELKDYTEKQDKFRIQEIYEKNHNQYYSQNTPLDYKSLSKYMDDHTKYYLKRNIKNG